MKIRVTLTIQREIEQPPDALLRQFRKVPTFADVMVFWQDYAEYDPSAFADDRGAITSVLVEELSP